MGYLDVLGISSMLDAPIWQNGRVYGVICIEHVGEPRHWSNDGGNLTVTSEEGRGSNFVVEIPVRVLQQKNADKNKAVKAPGIDLNRLR